MELRGKTSVMGKPPTLLKSVHTARAFFANHDLILYRHGHDVLNCAKMVGMVEPAVINHPRSNPSRAWKNSVLAELMLYHTVDWGKLQRTTMPLPKPLTREDVRRELAVFSELTGLARRGAPASEHVHLLNDGEAPLALLAMMADQATTHMTAGKTIEFVHTPSELFRYYLSDGEAESALRMSAGVGEKIYAPLAELFGYPTLAGAIFEHAYRVNHSAVYNAVTAQLADPNILSRMTESQKLISRLLRVLRSVLDGLGIEGEMHVRMAKHTGKVIRKVHRILSKRYEEDEMQDSLSLNEYISANAGTYDITRLTDLVAAKIVLDRIRGISIDSLPESQRIAITGMISEIIERQIRLMLFFTRAPETYIELFNKDNGYVSWHINAMLESQDPLVSFEIQVKTREWDDVAAHGKAAHFFYIGGESEFVEKIRGYYHELLRMFNGNGK